MLRDGCKGCENRHLGCHADCNRYKEFVEYKHMIKNNELTDIDKYKKSVYHRLIVPVITRKAIT